MALYRGLDYIYNQPPSDPAKAQRGFLCSGSLVVATFPDMHALSHRCQANP